MQAKPAPSRLLDAIKGLPRMWKKRREIQAHRVVSGWEMRKMMEKGWPLRGRE